MLKTLFNSASRKEVQQAMAQIWRKDGKGVADHSALFQTIIWRSGPCSNEKDSLTSLRWLAPRSVQAVLPDNSVGLAGDAADEIGKEVIGLNVENRAAVR